MNDPIVLRIDAPFRNRRYSLWSDRLVLEVRDFIGGWTPEQMFFIDEIDVLYRYRRPLRSYFLFLIPVPLLALAGVALMSVSWIAAGICFGLAGLVTTLSTVSALRSRPWLRVRDRQALCIDIRMDRPLFRKAKRVAFFRALFEALKLPPPADLGE